jgi:hypothetical protein
LEPLAVTGDRLIIVKSDINDVHGQVGGRASAII